MGEINTNTRITWKVRLDSIAALWKVELATLTVLISVGLAYSNTTGYKSVVFMTGAALDIFMAGNYNGDQY